MSAPYKVGDRARVLHADARGATVLGALEVVSVEALPGAEPHWLLVFAGTNQTAIVDRAGRDRHGYVEPVRS